MARRNFHKLEDPKKAAIEFWKSETKSGLKVFWDRGHISDHQQHGGVGTIFASGPEAKGYDSHPNRFMLIKTMDDIDEAFCYYEDNE
jgi:hypothetical protein